MYRDFNYRSPPLDLDVTSGFEEALNLSPEWQAIEGLFPEETIGASQPEASGSLGSRGFEHIDIPSILDPSVIGDERGLQVIEKGNVAFHMVRQSSSKLSEPDFLLPSAEVLPEVPDGGKFTAFPDVDGLPWLVPSNEAPFLSGGDIEMLDPMGFGVLDVCESEEAAVSEPPRKKRKVTRPRVSEHEIAKQWHPELNGDLRPEDFTQGSEQQIWWQCQKDPSHKPRKARIGHRFDPMRPTLCPDCKGWKKRLVSEDEIAKQWHPTLNVGKDPKDYTQGSQKKVWWQCKKNSSHSWREEISARCNPFRASVCPACSVEGKPKVSEHEIAKQWHPLLNEGMSPKDFTLESQEEVWWQCQKNPFHSWREKIYLRYNPFKTAVCPSCPKEGKPKVSEHELAKEWHPTLNAGMNPEDFTQGSGKEVWWMCQRGLSHPPWKRRISSRFGVRKAAGCPHCQSHRKPFLRDHPVASQLHPILNEGINLEGLTQGSRTKVWWVCEKDSSHEPWQATIRTRCRDKSPSGCPTCPGSRISSKSK